MQNYTNRYQTFGWSVAALALAIAGSPLAAQDATISLKGITAVTSFSPTSGVKGTQVTLTGLNLSGVTAVRFGTTAAPLRSKTSTTVVTNVPDIPGGSYTIWVSTVDGDTGKSGFIVTVAGTVALLTPLQLASNLKAAGASADSVALALKAAPYNQTADQVSLIEAQVTFAATAIAFAEQRVYQKGSAAVVKLLRTAGFAATASAQAEHDAFAVTAAVAAADLQAAGYAANDVANAERQVYAKTAQETAQLLKTVGFTVSVIATAERTVYGQTAVQTASILKVTSYGILDIYNAVMSAFTLTKTDLISILESIGFTYGDILKAIG